MLFEYLNDGADVQSRAVLAMLSDKTIEYSYSQEHRKHLAKVSVSRWENGREQGYCLSMTVEAHQINIAFFEHRNSDEICAVVWEQVTTNSPTIESAIFGNIYRDKFDVSHNVGYGEILSMVNFIHETLEAFYISNCKKLQVANHHA